MKAGLLAAVPMLLACAYGCNNTAEGVKEDVRQDSQKASEKLKEGIDNAGNIASNAAENMKDASGNAALTMRIKNAINADKDLNDSRNMVDVDTDKSVVTLKGHVWSASLKEKASTIAKEEMTKAKAEQKLDNQLAVQ